MKSKYNKWAAVNNLYKAQRKTPWWLLGPKDQQAYCDRAEDRAEFKKELKERGEEC